MRLPLLPHRKRQDAQADMTKAELLRKLEAADKATRRVNKLLERDGVTMVLKKAMGGRHG